MHDHWRDTVEVHPAADLFPMMSDAQLDALAKDIAAHGMHQGIVLWTPERTITADIEAGWKADFEVGRVPCGLSLLDGRNRLAAIERAFDDPGQCKAALSGALHGGVMALGVSIARPHHLNAHTDPFAFVISANIHRRHLTAEQKRKIVAQVLRADPERSDRQVAEMVKVGHPTVARVRQSLETSGDVEHRSTRTDSKGRQQPAKKPSRPTVATPAPPPAPTPMGKSTLVVETRDEVIVAFAEIVKSNPVAAFQDLIEVLRHNDELKWVARRLGANRSLARLLFAIETEEGPDSALKDQPKAATADPARKALACSLPNSCRRYSGCKDQGRCLAAGTAGEARP